MKETRVKTWWAKIYVAGPRDTILQTCRKYCEEGLCVTVEVTKFIYTGGEEMGVVIGLVNYPRFPSTPDAITDKAVILAKKIVKDAYQKTALVVTPINTVWIEK